MYIILHFRIRRIRKSINILDEFFVHKQITKQRTQRKARLHVVQSRLRGNISAEYFNINSACQLRKLKDGWMVCIVVDSIGSEIEKNVDESILYDLIANNKKT